jgi:hypothetical protein
LEKPDTRDVAETEQERLRDAVAETELERGGAELCVGESSSVRWSCWVRSEANCSSKVDLGVPSPDCLELGLERASCSRRGPLPQVQLQARGPNVQLSLWQRRGRQHPFQ